METGRLTPVVRECLQDASEPPEIPSPDGGFEDLRSASLEPCESDVHQISTPSVINKDSSLLENEEQTNIKEEFPKEQQVCSTLHEVDRFLEGIALDHAASGSLVAQSRSHSLLTKHRLSRPHLSNHQHTSTTKLRELRIQTSISKDLIGKVLRWCHDNPRVCMR